MIKLYPYFQSDKELQKIEEPYKSVAIILDRLYLKGPNGNVALSPSF